MRDYFSVAKICFQSCFISTTVQPRFGAAASASTSFPLLLGLASEVVNAFLAEHTPPVLDPFVGAG